MNSIRNMKSYVFGLILCVFFAHYAWGVMKLRHIILPAYISLSLATIQEKTFNTLPLSVQAFVPFSYTADYVLYGVISTKISPINIRSVPLSTHISQFILQSGIGYRKLFDASVVPLFSGGSYQVYHQMIGVYVIHNFNAINLTVNTDQTNQRFNSDIFGLEYRLYRVNLNGFAHVQWSDKKSHWNLDDFHYMQEKYTRYTTEFAYSLVDNFDVYGLVKIWQLQSHTQWNFQKTIGIRGFFFDSTHLLGGLLFDTNIGLKTNGYIFRASMALQININPKKNSLRLLDIEQRMLLYPETDTIVAVWERMQ